MIAKVRFMDPNGLGPDLLRRDVMLPPLISLVISNFIIVWPYVPFNPTKVTYRNKVGFWHISFILVIWLCSN